LSKVRQFTWNLPLFVLDYSVMLKRV
jgi:hypothetical protein